MMKRLNRWVRLPATVAVVLTTLLLAGCFDSVTRENFERIEQGMERDQVVAILGEPDESSTVKLGGLNGETAIWNGRNHRIFVSFAQGSVVVATLKNPQVAAEE